MKFYCGVVLLVFLFSSCRAFRELEAQDYDQPQGRFFLPHNRRRSISIFSRPPEDHSSGQKPPENPRQSGLLSHLGNAFSGGAIGIQIRPFGHLSHIVGTAKKIIPGRGTVGVPSHEVPDHPYDPSHPDRPYKPGHTSDPDRPHRPNYQDDPDYPEEPPKKEWEPSVEEPAKKPKPERPRWEDIGEETYDDGAGIIQPRVRSKRFIESKIYHVPLVYRSNARPYGITIRERNRFSPNQSLRTE